MNLKIMNHSNPVYFCIFIFLLSYEQGFSQYQTSIGISLGYSALGMSDVDDLMTGLYNWAKSEQLSIEPPEEMGGELIWGAQLLFREENHLFGIAYDRIAGSAGIFGADATGGIKNTYEIGTNEVMGVLGIQEPVTEVTSFSLRVYAGIGFATISHFFNYYVHNPAINDFDIENETSAIYFSGRLQAGVDINVDKAFLNISLAYRIADAGKISGPLILGDNSSWAGDLEKFSGRNIDINFSGLMFSLALDIPIF